MVENLDVAGRSGLDAVGTIEHEPTAEQGDGNCGHYTAEPPTTSRTNAPKASAELSSHHKSSQVPHQVVTPVRPSLEAR
jgi:hypothetical protein